MSNLKNLYGGVTVKALGAGPATGGRSSWERNSMRRSIINAVGLAQIAGAIVCQPVLGDITVLFTNAGEGLNAPVLDLQGNPLLPSADYRVCLYHGMTMPSVWAGREPLITALTSPGLFGAGQPPITIPNVEPEIAWNYWFQIKVWNVRGGRSPTFEQALAIGETELAESRMFQLSVPAGDPNATPPVPAPPLYGLASFTFPVVNPSIKITAPSIGTNGFTFTVTGPANGPLEIQAATNLTNQRWVPLLTGTLTNGSYTYTDAQWTSYPLQFYRVKLW